MSQAKIALPDGKRGWTLWSGRSAVGEDRELDDLVGQGNDVYVGVPATLATTFAVKIPTIEESLFSAMVQAQIEKRGLAHHGEGASTPHSFYLIEQDGNESLLSVDVLSEDFPETLSLSRAAGYAPSARLLRLPDDQLFLWREHKRLVLAVNRRGRLSHVQVLSAEPILSPAAAQEINLTTLSLQAEGLVEDAPELLVAGELVDGDREERSEFEKALLMPAEFTAEPVSPAPSLPDLDEGFLPTDVVGARIQRSSTRKRSVVGAFAAIIYVVLGAALWIYTQNTEAKITDLETKVAETRPGVKDIQETEARWKQLEPGFDLHYYPLVQLNEITRAMPGSGVVIREFETRGRDIRVRGRARDVQLAYRLKEDLEANPFFRAYSWDMGKPDVERDTTVRFDLQGTPKMRGLTTREKRLLGLCVLSIFIVANLIAGRSIMKTLKTSKEEIRTLETELAENQMWLEEEELWEGRRDWLDNNLPEPLIRQRVSTGNAQGQLVQTLQNELLELKVKIDRQNLVTPVNEMFYDEVAVYLRIEGDAAKINNWLATLQSREKFQVIKSLELELDGRSREVEPQAECEVTIARWFAPSAGLSSLPEEAVSETETETEAPSDPESEPETTTGTENGTEAAPAITPATEPAAEPAPATTTPGGEEAPTTESTAPAEGEKEKVELTERS